MIPFLFFLACSDSENTKTTVPPSVDPPNTPSTHEKTSPQTNAEVPVVPAEEELSSKETPQLNVLSEENPLTTQKPLASSIPSPKIEGMVQKEKENKIHAEDIDAYINQEKNEEDRREDKIVQVELKEMFNEYLNDSNSEIYVQVYKDPSSIAASMSHDHAIRARGWEGQVIWKESEPHNCIFEFQIPVHFFDVDPDNLRKKLNLPGTLSKKDKKEVRKNMLSKNQLWAKKYAHISFSADRCAIEEEGVRVDGSIKIRGITKKISTVLAISSESNVRIKGSFYLNQTSFGITPYSAFMGAVKNKNRIKISLDLNR